jgi:hypothetical protein
MDPEIEKKPTFDISVLLPVLLGVFSLLGILMVFMLGRFNENRALAPAEDTPTPFKYQLIGTEPGISTSELTEEPIFDLSAEPGTPGTGENGEPAIVTTRPPDQGLVVTAQQGGVSGSGSTSNTSVPKTKTSSSAIQTAAGNATDPIIILGTKKPTSTSYDFVFRTHTPSRTPGPTITVTVSRTIPPQPTKSPTAGTPPSNTPEGNTPTATPEALFPSNLWYEDTHSFILYDSGWKKVTDQTDPKNTLHVSDKTDSTLTFRFTGQQVRLRFQPTNVSSVIRISIDGKFFDLNEANTTNEWVSGENDFTYGTHNVTITHLSGGSVNIDAIYIPIINTPVPATGQ